MSATQALFSSLARMGEDIGQARVLDRAERLATRQANTEMELARTRANLAERQFQYGQQQDIFQRGLATRQQDLYERQLQQQGWHGLPTPVKDASGNYSLVYYNIHSGERKAIPIGAAPPGTYEYSRAVAQGLQKEFPDLTLTPTVSPEGGVGFSPYVKQDPESRFLALIQQRQAGRIKGLPPARSYEEARRWAQSVMAESGAAGIGGARIFNPGAFLRQSGFINEANLPKVVMDYLKLDSRYKIGMLMIQAALQAQMAGFPADPAQYERAQGMMDEATIRAYQQAKLPVPSYLQQLQQPAGGWVKMRGPDGSLVEVRPDKVADAERMGYKRQ